MGKYICKVKVTNGNTHMKAKGKKVGWSNNNKKGSKK